MAKQKKPGPVLRIPRVHGIGISSDERIVVPAAKPYLRTIADSHPIPIELPKYPSRFAFTPDGATLIVVSTQGELAAFDAHIGGAPRWTDHIGAETSGGDFGLDGSVFYLGSTAGVLVAWDVGSGERLHSLALPRLFDRVFVGAEGRLSVRHQSATSPPDQATWLLLEPDLTVTNSRTLPGPNLASEVLPAGDGAVVRLHDEVVGVDAQGIERWRKRIPEVGMRGLVRIDIGRVLAASATDWHVLEPRTGAVLHHITPPKCWVSNISGDAKWIGILDDRGGEQVWLLDSLLDAWATP